MIKYFNAKMCGLAVIIMLMISSVSLAGVEGGGLWGGQSAALGQRHERHGGSFRSTMPRGYKHNHYQQPYYQGPVRVQQMYQPQYIYGPSYPSYGAEIIILR